MKIVKFKNKKVKLKNKIEKNVLFLKKVKIIAMKMKLIKVIKMIRMNQIEFLKDKMELSKNNQMKKKMI